jgi:hypothetical protein
MEAALAGAEGPAAWLDRMESQVLRTASGAFDNYSATAVVFRPREAVRRAPPERGLGSRLLIVAGIALGLLAVANAVRCAAGPVQHPLVLSRAPAGALPGCEPDLGCGTGPQLHSVPAETPGGVGW